MMDSTPPVAPLPRPAVIREERPIEVLSADGSLLEGRISIPAGATRAVVLAHPHPLYGGTMDDPVTVAIGRVLGERGLATLRFNFRGVGKSEGRWSGGGPEIGDVQGAVKAMKRALAARPEAARGSGDVPISVAAYSFGSWAALRAARRGAEIERLALIAPAASLFTYEGGPRYAGPLAIALGDRDGFCDAPRARVLAGRLGASIAVLSGEDHFFARSRRKLADLLAPFLAGQIDRIDEGSLV